jgi:2-methylcitrate dehydratase PrpD
MLMTKHDRTLSLERNNQLAAYVTGTATRHFPPEVFDAARRALVDFLGVSVGGHEDAPSRPVRRLVEAWNTPGKARVFLGGRTTPALAALANGTAAHAMDYDDTHPMGGGHASAPCWSTALAVAEERGSSETQALAAFITGYEIMTRLGGGGPPGVGRGLQRLGFHPTSVFGRTGAAAAAAALMGLDAAQVSSALGVAATTAGGLVGSFGTHAKPFHAGKAAMDGIMAAQLAAEGFVAASNLYEIGAKAGVLSSFLQSENPQVPPLDFDARWELLGNAFKLFASCRSTHPAAQAARSAAAAVAGRKAAGHTVAKVLAKLHPQALVVAGKLDPQRPLEGKFSVPFCIALGLTGYRLVDTDFCEATMQNQTVRELLPRIVCTSVENQPAHAAHLEITFDDGSVHKADIDIVIGHPLNPVGWDDLRTKFDGLVEPLLGAPVAAELFETARAFGVRPGALARISTLLAGPENHNRRSAAGA